MARDGANPEVMRFSKLQSGPLSERRITSDIGIDVLNSPPAG